MVVAWYRFSLEEIYKKLGTSEKGLSSAKAKEKIKIFGPNKLPEPKVDTLWVIFFRQFKSPLIYVLLAAMVVVFWLGEYIDGSVILFVLLFNAVVGTVQEGRSQNALSALRKLVETYVLVLRDGKEILLKDDRIVPGDVIIIAEGDKVPADCRLIDVNNLRVDEAALTGESSLVHKTIAALRGEKVPVTDRHNMVFMGTSIIGGNALGIVVATGLKTEIGRISKIIATIDTEIPFKANIRNLSRLIIVSVAVISIFLLAIGFLRGDELRSTFLLVVALAVSVIPEGLPVVTTLILAFGVMRMAKRNALVKRLQAVEALGQTRVFAIDKTGTITRNEMVIRQIFVNDTIFNVTGEGYKTKGKVFLGNKEARTEKFSELELAGRIASLSANVRLAEEKFIGDPTEVAILVLARKMGMKKAELEKKYPLIGSIPFSYKTKYNTTFHKVDGKKFTTIIGAPESVLALCKKIWINGKILKFDKKQQEKANEVLRVMSGNSLRILAFSFSEGGAMVFGGFYGMEDAIREEAAATVKKIQEAGIKTVMITGDYKDTAIAIAKQAGIFKKGDNVLTGKELMDLSSKELDALVDKTTVFARVTPEHKMKIIEAYRRRGEVVAMSGDGVNDAPSLVAADLGVVMGKIGTEVAKEAGDIILLDDNFGTITVAIEEGRHIYQTIKKTILFLFSTSLGEILAIVGALLIGWPLLLLPSQIIWLNLVTDGFLDVSFAWEPKSKDLLKGSFERPKKYLINKLMVERSILMGITMMISGLFVFSYYFQTDMPKALTMSLTVLAIMQWFNAWNVRSENESIFKMNPLTNKFLMAMTLVVIVLQVLVIYWGPLQAIFKTVPLNTFDWLLAIAASSLIIVAEEVRKMFYR